MTRPMFNSFTRRRGQIGYGSSFILLCSFPEVVHGRRYMVRGPVG